jgi:hypothetical protein
MVTTDLKNRWERQEDPTPSKPLEPRKQGNWMMEKDKAGREQEGA